MAYKGKEEELFNTVSLLKSITEIVDFNIDDNADLFGRDLINLILTTDRGTQPVSPDMDELLDGAISYVKTIIYSSLLLRENSNKIELRAHTLKNLSIPDNLYQSLSGIGSVDLPYYGVHRIISITLDDKEDIMKTETIEAYCFMLQRYFKRTDVKLSSEVPFHKLGNEKKMSLTMAASETGEIHIASHQQCSVVDAQNMAAMYPSLRVILEDGTETNVSARIPASISHQPQSKLLRDGGFVVPLIKVSDKIAQRVSNVGEAE